MNHSIRVGSFLACWFSGMVTVSLNAEPIPDTCRVNGLAVGCQAWTFKAFPLLDAIDKTAAAGGKIIEFYPDQALSADQPGVKFNHNADDSVIALVKARLAKDGVRPVNYGVVPIPNDEAGARKIFEFGRKFNLYGLTTESVGSIDLIEKLVKEYDIRVGFHDHQKRVRDPGYRMWDPNYVLSIVKDRDSRIGACADTGHWVQSGLKPVDCLKLLQGRIVSVHLHDMNDMTPDAHDVPAGTGVSDVAGILSELKRQNFVGNISIEYEYNWKNNLADVSQSISYIRNFDEHKQ